MRKERHNFPSYQKVAHEQAFQKELLGKAKVYLKENNDHRFADQKAWFQYAALMLAAGGFYFSALHTTQAWVFMVCYIVFMFTSVVLALNAFHDAAHAAIFRNYRINWLLNRLISIPLGLEPEYWRVRHNIFHHGYPNVEGHDLDIEENGVLRQAPKQKWFPHMQFQHIYWPFVSSCALVYMAWYFDWRDRLGLSPLKTKNVLKGWQGWLLFLSHKVFHFVLCLLLPIVFGMQNGIGWGTVLTAYFISQMISSIIIVFMFLGTHWVAPTFNEPDESNTIQCGWYWHCFGTTCDWDPPAFLVFWLGGADYHLTHHLFPSWHHRHYRPLAEIVKTVSQKYDYPYRRINYRTLLKEQAIFLKHMGKNPRDLEVG